jgi:hypothetical protein
MALRLISITLCDFCLLQVICALALCAPVFSSENAETQYRPALIKYEVPQTGESYVVALIDFDDDLTGGIPHPTYQKVAKEIMTNAKNWLTEGYKQDYKNVPNLDPQFFDSLGTPLDGRSRMVVVFKDESLTKILGTMRIAYSTEEHPELPMHTPAHTTSVPDSEIVFGKYPFLQSTGNGITWELAPFDAERGNEISWELAPSGGPVGVEFKNFRKAPDAPDAVVPLMFYAAEKARLTNAMVTIHRSSSWKTVARPGWYQLECLDPLTGYYETQGWKTNGTMTSESGPTLHYYLTDRLGFLQMLIGNPDGKKGMIQRPGADFIRKAQGKMLLFDHRFFPEEKLSNPLLECLKAGFLKNE